MIKRFYAEPALANSFWVLVVCGVVFIIGSWDAGTIHKSGAQLILLSFFLLTGLFWAGAKYGTYVLIDEEKNILCNSRSFIKKTILISDIKKIITEETFAGALNIPIIVYQNKKGKLKESRMISTDTFKPNELKELLQLLKDINPEIEIDPSLLN